MTRNLIVSLLLIGCASGFAPANAEPEIRSCGGILHRDKDGLRFGRGKGEPEFICVVRRTEDRKVLARCRVGKYCEVEGLADFCPDSGESSHPAILLSSSTPETISSAGACTSLQMSIPSPTFCPTCSAKIAAGESNATPSNV